MPAYQNLGGNSSVDSFDDTNAPNEITVTFKSGRWRHYQYTATSCGAANVARLLQLAAAGQGLGSFINRNAAVRNGYARKW